MVIGVLCGKVKAPSYFVGINDKSERVILSWITLA